jgi:hypothetical protein
VRHTHSIDVVLQERHSLVPAGMLPRPLHAHRDGRGTDAPHSEPDRLARNHGRVLERWQEFLSFLKTLRRRKTRRLRLIIVLDNFSPHLRAEVRIWVAANNVRLVFTPTNASWLNRIEPLFAGVRDFALNNSDYRDHDETRRAIFAFDPSRSSRLARYRRRS